MEHTRLFQILADETRLRALALMHNVGEVCICELVHALELSQPKISRHMAALRAVGLAEPRRDAQWVFYKLNPNLPEWQQKVVTAALENLAEDPSIAANLSRLKTMCNRPERCAA